MKINKALAQQALYGGLLLGAGGGGRLVYGMQNVEDTFSIRNTIEVKGISEFQDNDIFVNVSVLGAPSADIQLTEKHWFEALRLFNLNYPKGFQAIMGNENGPMATANGFVLSALTGIPLVDAPGSGRAVPIAPFTCMNLSVDQDYQTTHAVCGGVGENYVACVMQGAFGPITASARYISTLAGGMVYVLRNPVTKAYAEKYAAVGGLTHAIELGAIIQEYLGNCDRLIAALQSYCQVEVLGEGIVKNFALNCSGGWDRGSFHVVGQSKNLEYTFWNEYMTIQDADERTLAVFPELMNILDAKTGMPICSAEIENGRKVVAIKAPLSSLRIGSGLRLEQNYLRAEKAICRRMIPRLKQIGLL